ncbi:CbiX/SirB N-terminal domain-containing protein [Paenibacillus chondroitinus]|uniref:CbiX/SirB N-terminal domain-containing protein n=1 Tax=Paenibacillus chondroitinus TaxID=59842 RepID=A0ABU6DM73_9BACL|nr:MULTISPECIES: CbiX/SirB N-terminal domain-containing protein [Paenibacillus]MCY9661010.1 cobalamin biosynthesis protein CbiX [Paenibacillus anseongense]MEB4797931.1 CbiX/SirB N-terminal domain-containing protein [Paenibacillus chondroitinus]
MSKVGVLVISHGSRDKGWVDLVDEAVSAVHMPEGMPIYASYLELVEGRLIQDGIYSLEAQGVTDIIVVPLFVSSGSTHIDEISYALGVIEEPLLETDMEPFEIKARIHFTSPIDDDPVIAEIMYAKIKELSEQPTQEILLLIGHGSQEEGFHQKWLQGLEQLAERLKTLGGFDEADVAMLLPDQVHAKMTEWAAKKPGHAVIVAPLFLSEGYFTRQVIPSRLKGFAYTYNGRALLPSPLISKWMEKQIASANSRR